MASQVAVSLFQADLVHLPIRHDRAQIQQLFQDMSRKVYGGYRNLAFQFANIEMFTVYDTGGSSRLQLLPDRFRLVENNSGIGIEDFKARFEVSMASAAHVFGLAAFPFQHVKMRIAAQPTLFNDAIEFLSHRICRFDQEDLDGFGRRASAFSMAFRFLATPEDNSTFSVKVEAFEEPQQALMLEVEGGFGDAIPADDLGQAGQNVQTTYDFVHERTLQFLNRYDHGGE